MLIKEEKTLAPNMPSGEDMADNFLSDILFTNENLDFAFKANMASLGYIVARGGFNILRRRFIQGAASVGVCSMFGPIAGGICGTVAGLAGMALAAYDIYYIYDEIQNKEVPVKKAIGFDNLHNELKRLATRRITNSTDFQTELAIRTARNSLRDGGKGMRQKLYGDNERRWVAFRDGKSPIMWAPPGSSLHCGTKLIGRPGTTFGDRKIQIKTDASTWGFKEDDPELKRLFTGDISSINWPTIEKKNSECSTSREFANRIANDYKTALDQWLRMGAPEGGLKQLKSTEDKMYEQTFKELISDKNGCVPDCCDDEGYHYFFEDSAQAKRNLSFVTYALKKLKNRNGVPYLNSTESDEQCSINIVKGITNFQKDNRTRVQHFYRGKMVAVTMMANKHTIRAMADALGLSKSDEVLQGVKY